MLLRITRLFVGILLIPICVAVTRSVGKMIMAIQPGTDAAIPAAGLALAGGLLAWLAVYFLLPAPIRTYVLAHELTHALWGMFMFARVSNIRVAKAGGSVTVSKTNFLITLAPYFFPLYTVIIILTYYIMTIFYNMDPYFLWWLGLIGFTWGFHVTFTISSLFQHQSDIKECGHIFSYAIIYLFNILGVALWVIMVSSATLQQFTRLLKKDTVYTGSQIWHGSQKIAAWLKSR
jgi:hypothetical protein